VKVAAGKINAVTGDEWTDGIHQRPQDYMPEPGELPEWEVAPGPGEFQRVALPGKEPGDTLVSTYPREDPADEYDNVYQRLDISYGVVDREGRVVADFGSHPGREISAGRELRPGGVIFTSGWTAHPHHPIGSAFEAGDGRGQIQTCRGGGGPVPAHGGASHQDVLPGGPLPGLHAGLRRLPGG
jgi:hypothetical protein